MNAADASPRAHDLPPDAAPVTVFACGEPQRGDDAVAFAIVDALPPALRDRIGLVCDGSLDAAMLIDLPEGRACVVVDAVNGIAPGEVLTLPLADVSRRARERISRPGGASPRSSHLISIESALALAELLLGEPVRGTFVGVGIKRCDLGTGLSPEVIAALPQAVAALAAAIERHAAEVKP